MPIRAARREKVGDTETLWCTGGISASFVSQLNNYDFKYRVATALPIVFVHQAEDNPGGPKGLAGAEHADWSNEEAI